MGDESCFPKEAGVTTVTSAGQETERASWSSYNAVGAYGSSLKLVLAGTRQVSNGTIVNAGSYGVYWSSTVCSTVALIGNCYLGFGSTDAGVYIGGPRAAGYSIRCLKD